MASKTIPKAALHKAIGAQRRYCLFGGLSELDVISEACLQIERLSGVSYFCLTSFIAAFFYDHGLKNDATNEDIEAILRLLGWEVSG